MKYVCWLLIIITAASAIIIAVWFFLRVYNDSYAAALRKYKMMEVGWSFQQVADLLGAGKQIDKSEVPTTPSFSQNDGSPLRPVVNGDVIFVWQGSQHAIYVGFDKSGKVVSKFFSDHNSL